LFIIIVHKEEKRRKVKQMLKVTQNLPLDIVNSIMSYTYKETNPFLAIKDTIHTWIDDYQDSYYNVFDNDSINDSIIQEIEIEIIEIDEEPHPNAQDERVIDEEEFIPLSSYDLDKDYEVNFKTWYFNKLFVERISKYSIWNRWVNEAITLLDDFDNVLED